MALRLGAEFTWFNSDLAITLDLSQGKFSPTFAANSQKTQVAKGQAYTLERNKLVLANTVEKVTLPILEGNQCLAARVEGRSSFARCGLLVHFTAPTIHAGFSGNITLELINLGPYPISLRPGSYICQLIVEEVAGTPIQNESQFHNQSRPGGT